jgi:hypothetical protein
VPSSARLGEHTRFGIHNQPSKHPKHEETETIERVQQVVAERGDSLHNDVGAISSA